MSTQKKQPVRLLPLSGYNPLGLRALNGDYSRVLAVTVRAQRQALGISVEQAAARAGMSPEHWAALEEGDWLPKDYRTEKKIAAAVEADEFHVGYFTLLSSVHRQQKVQ